MGTELEANHTDVFWNSATSAGGGFSVRDTSELACFNCSIALNTASSGGGMVVARPLGVSNAAARVAIAGGAHARACFRGNSALKDGGAVAAIAWGLSD